MNLLLLTLKICDSIHAAHLFLYNTELFSLDQGLQNLKLCAHTRMRCYTLDLLTELKKKSATVCPSGAPSGHHQVHPWCQGGRGGRRGKGWQGEPKPMWVFFFFNKV